MTCKELIMTMQYPNGKRLYLQDWEKEFIIERAKEEKFNNKEMEILLKGLKDDMFEFDVHSIYNLLTGECYTIKEICEKHNLKINLVKYRIRHKICINGIPYSYNEKALPLLYRVNVESLYHCPELNALRTASCWKKCLNDDKMNLSSLSRGSRLYKGKYHFNKKNIYLVEVL